ncbi:hypothetical protein [Krasilnikovia sp. MM14-A1259]|uniref:hypothetical protein n=1 Tax=Krasilnikovia sp. MM14-A1259 TaxID=3373539 RepID=UPI0038280F3C
MATSESADGHTAGLLTLGKLLDGDAAVGPDRTRIAVQALTTGADYLATALGPGVPASVPSTVDVADLLVGLHITVHRLHTGLQQLHAGIARRTIVGDVPIVTAAKLQSALGIAVERLGTAALTLGAAGALLGSEPPAPERLSGGSGRR